MFQKLTIVVASVVVASVIGFSLYNANAPDTEQALVEKAKRENEKWRQEAQAKMEARYDLTRDCSNICPVHHLPMNVCQVPIRYGLLIENRTAPTAGDRQHLFPFAQDWIAGGCVYSEGFPKKGKVYVCPECVRAQKLWYSEHSK